MPSLEERLYCPFVDMLSALAPGKVRLVGMFIGETDTFEELLSVEDELLPCCCACSLNCCKSAIDWALTTEERNAVVANAEVKVRSERNTDIVVAILLNVSMSNEWRKTLPLPFALTHRARSRCHGHCFQCSATHT